MNNEILFNELMKTAAPLNRPRHIHPHGRPHVHPQGRPYGRPQFCGNAGWNAGANSGVNVTVTVNVNGENVNAENAGRKPFPGCGRDEGWHKHPHFGAGRKPFPGCGKGEGWHKHPHFGADRRPRILDLIPEDGGISLQALAENLRLPPQAISGAAARLEERGLIRREENGDDGRVTLIFLTEKGAQLRSFFREKREAFTGHYFSALTEDEKENLYALLSKLNEARFKEFAQHAHCRCKKPEAE